MSGGGDDEDDGHDSTHTLPLTPTLFSRFLVTLVTLCLCVPSLTRAQPHRQAQRFPSIALSLSHRRTRSLARSLAAAAGALVHR